MLFRRQKANKEIAECGIRIAGLRKRASRLSTHARRGRDEKRERPSSSPHSAFRIPQSVIAVAVGCLLVAALFLLPPRPPAHAQTSAQPNLLEVGGASKPLVLKDAPAELKVVSYNIRWRGGEQLQKLIKL